MFTWICPKCGGEVPPSYTECPRCSPKPAREAAPAASPVEPAPPPPPVAPPAPVPPPVVAAPAPPPPVTVASAPLTPAPPPALGPALQSRRLPPAVVAFAAGLGIVALLAVLYLWVLPRRTPTAAAPPAAAVENPGAPGSSEAAHPLAKHLEVAGVRVMEDRSGRAKVQFLIVNHSGADLPEMTLQMTLAAAGREFFTFPVTVPSVGPYESRDLTATVTTDLKPYELPDWQMVRPQFRITATR